MPNTKQPEQNKTSSKGSGDLPNIKNKAEAVSNNRNRLTIPPTTNTCPKQNKTISEGKVLKTLGKDELWCHWFECPKCEDINIRVGNKFCPNCGFSLKDYKFDVTL